MKKDDPIAAILAHTMLLGFGLGAAMGMVFQAIFFHLSWQTILWGFGFGAIGGLVVGIIDGVNALWILLRFFRTIPNVGLFRLVLNGVLMLATIVTTIAVYTPIFFFISGSLSAALLFVFPIVFSSALCSLVASHILGSWYLRHIAASQNRIEE